MPPNRIVALFAPLVALAAGVSATWLTEHVSGLEVTAGQLEAVFIAALTAVLAPAAQWLHGSQKLARFEAELERAALDADTRAADRAGEQDLEAAYEPEDEGYEYEDTDVLADVLADEYEAARDDGEGGLEPVPSGA